MTVPRIHHRELDDPDYVEYGAPPVVEVVLAVAFAPLSRFNLVDQAELWRTRFKARFPTSEEKPPYQMPVEALDGPPVTGLLSLNVLSMPPLPRLWFIDPTGSRIIQLQRDMIAHNWRSQGSEEYPRYEPLRDEFARTYGELADFVEGLGLGEVQPTQAEITYVNHIRRTGSKLPALSDILRIGIRRTHGLPRPESERLAVDFPISANGAPQGRLHLTANPATMIAGGDEIVELTLTARGKPVGANLEGILAFLDLGSRFATDTFDIVTTTAMHLKWGRK